MRQFSQTLSHVRTSRLASATCRALRQGCISTSQQITGTMPAKGLQRAIGHVKAGICGKALGNSRVQCRRWRMRVKAARRMPARKQRQAAREDFLSMAVTALLPDLHGVRSPTSH